MQVSILVFTNV